ncbi:hypothetical protein Btru_057167 [Bulinus truncatus]|nr:hypothetical protein Btru_057167 [Bulinus truncatus]
MIRLTFNLLILLIASTAALERCKKSIVDLIFVLDSSGSIVRSDYDKELQFTSDLTSVFNVSPNLARVGAVIFSQFPEKLFDLNKYTNYYGVSQALLKAKYLKDATYTDKALNLIVDDGMFSARAGGRPNANRVVVVLTDGRSANTALTEKAALRVKGLNATIVAVGFGDAYDLELKKIASRPEYVFKAKDMSQLSDTKWTLAELICKGSTDSTCRRSV